MKQISLLILSCFLLCGCAIQQKEVPTQSIDLFKDLSVTASVNESGDIIRTIEGTEQIPDLLVRIECENVCANGESATLSIPNVRKFYKELPDSSKEIVLEGQPELLDSFNDLSQTEQERLVKQMFETVRSKVWWDRAYRYKNKRKALDSIQITQVGFVFKPTYREGQVIIPGENRLILGLTSDSSFGEQYSYHQVFIFESIIKDKDQWKFIFRNAQNGAPIWNDLEFQKIMERCLIDDHNGEPIQNEINEMEVRFECSEPSKPE